MKVREREGERKRRLTRSAISPSFATKEDVDVDIGTTSIPAETRNGWASTISKFVIKFADNYCPR